LQPAERETERLNSGSKHKRSVFEFKDVSFSVMIKSKEDGKKVEKIINREVSGRVESGHVLAILGPSGAGKSTLINALTLSAIGGKTTGEITLDEAPLTYEMLRRRAFVVAQQDFHWTFLTCRETLKYAADLYLNSSEDEKNEMVDGIIDKMGLASCADTRVGNEFIKGLSGGQKRRLSIGLALVKRPDIIFLDEPTSGLDAASAAKIMTFIKETAARENLMFITTIHQPSTAVFNGFDQVMILSQGRQAYVGDAAEALTYFESIGHGIPPNTNPADFFLDLVNADFTSQEQVDSILDAWDKKRQGGKASLTRQASFDADTGKYSKPTYNTTLSSQINVMIRRHFTLAARDPMLYLGRCLVFLFANMFFAIIYIQSRHRDQDQVVNKMFINVWFIGVPANVGVIAVYAYNAEYKAIRREIRNGLVSPTAYVVANSVLQIPVMFLFAIFSLCVPAYGIGNFNAERMGWQILLFAACMYSWEALAQVLSVQFDNPLLGMMNFVQGWFTAFVFAGFLIRRDDIVWPFKVFTWIFPLRYTIRGMVYNEIIDTSYESCADIGDDPCFGDPAVTGRQDGGDVLNSLGDVFGPFSDENTLAEDILVPLGLAIFFKICHTYMLNMKSKESSKVLPPN